MDLLGSAAIIELAKAQQKLLSLQRVAVKKAPWLKDALCWCHEHEIDLGQQGSRQFWISRAGIVAVEQWLTLHDQGSLKHQAQTRIGERHEVSSSNEKIAQIKPMDQRVLCASCDLAQRLNQQHFFNLVTTPAQVNVELAYSQIELSQYSHLVVIENRDSFNDWHRYLPYTQGLSQALIVYRGHEKQHSKGCKSLKLRWQYENGHNGLVYFGDADIAGLGIAMAGDVPYQHLLLPSLDCLIANLDPLQANPDYDYARRNLGNQLIKRWLPLYEVLNQKAGLRQQNMFNLGLVLY